MIKTTKEQRKALKRVYDRSPFGIPYKAFRAAASGTFGMGGAIVVQWCGMWLCIETDGYCHS